MLKHVLKEISTARILDIADLARKLNITEGLVEDLMDQLDRMGYIDEDMSSLMCETKCSSCEISTCTTVPVKILRITKKGEELLKNI